jgi:hypothetical protein
VFCMCYAVVSDFRELVIQNWIVVTLVAAFPERRRNWMRLSCGPLIDVMEACEDRYCDDLCSLGASMRCKWHRRAGRTLSNRTVWAPAVDQDLLQMALIEDEHVVQAAGGIAAVAVMNEKARRLAVPTAASDPKVGSRCSCDGSGPAAPGQSGGAPASLCDLNAGANTSATRDGASAGRFRVSQ